MRTLLVANRGEIAARVFRSARALGLRTVAVYEQPDRAAPYVGQADLAAPVERYLDADAIVAAARRCGADAVHPGYGYLSENAAFASACAAAGLTFVGPSPEVIEAMGSKIRAKELARAAGVPVLDDVVLDDDPEQALRLGLPLLLKPSAGGGGKGMRLVERPEDLAEALSSARREAVSSFGDGTLFAERWLAATRHVEVQLLGDAHGRVVAVGERECSVQRRHQKILEEAPVPGVGALRDAALALARSLGYTNAGTVEFLVDGEEFFFLEMNTRLQVEHPVTEAVTGLDLVALQLRIAAGEPLPFADVTVSGHAIEARLYAEDPADDFLPAPGRVRSYRARPVPGVRRDEGVATGTQVDPRYDPLLAKVIAHGETRAIAIARLEAALRGTALHGIATNRDYLLAVLASDDFRAGRISTGFVSAHPELLAAGPDQDAVRWHAAAAALALALRAAGPLAPAAWRNVRSADARRTFLLNEPVEVGYRPERDGTWHVTVGDRRGPARAALLDDQGLDLELFGVRRRCRVQDDGDAVLVDSANHAFTFGIVADLPVSAPEGPAGGQTAPLPGLVVAVEVKPGDTVAPGDTLVVLEAMKMEHRIRAAVAGTVGQVLVQAGQAVDAHEVLVVIE